MLSPGTVVKIPFATPITTSSSRLSTNSQSALREESEEGRPSLLSCFFVQRATVSPEIASHHEVCTDTFYVDGGHHTLHQHTFLLMSDDARSRQTEPSFA